MKEKYAIFFRSTLDAELNDEFNYQFDFRSTMKEVEQLKGRFTVYKFIKEVE